MTCTLIKDKLTKDFVDKGAINVGNNKILDKSLFNFLNEQYSLGAKEKFQLDDLEYVFKAEDNKAIANEEYLSKLDRLSNSVKAHKEKFEAQSKEEVTDELIKTISNNKIEEATRNFYKKFEAFVSRDGSYISTQNDTLATTEQKIQRMQEAFDAVVLVDNDMKSSGVLLSANHPLTVANGKPVIKINPNKLFDDTVFHEFGHLYVELLGGLQDPVVAAAVDKLRDSKLWKEVQDNYPELQDEDLAKEVLATALGHKGNEIFNTVEDESIWQQIKTGLLDLLAKIFGYKHNNAALEQLASEMLKNKVRANNVQAFNALIDQYSKYKIEGTPTQEKADKLFTDLKEDFTLHEDTHTYENVKEKKSFTSSVSSFAKNMILGRDNYNYKGRFDMPFTEMDELTEDEYEMTFTDTRIPWSLDKAIGNYFSGDLEVSPAVVNRSKTYWYDFYVKNLLGDPNSLFTGLNKAAIKAINDNAHEIEKNVKQKPAIVGTEVHNVLENYINAKQSGTNYTFPANIKDEQGDLLNTIKGIVDTGMANGSKFYTEQILFSEAAQKPGTADLIEITKDGKFRIYDFKTMDSFTDGLGNQLSDYKLYIRKGYLNQLLIYSTMLEEYGLEPADNHLNIVSIEVDSSEYDIEDEAKRDINITGIINKNISPSDNKFATSYKEAEQRILAEFTHSEKMKEDYNLETKEEKLQNLIKKIQRAVDDYKNKTDIFSGKFTGNNDMLNVNPSIYNLEKDIEKYINKNNELIIYKFVDNIRAALVSIHGQILNAEEGLSGAYLQNVDYLLQVSSFISDVKNFLDTAEESVFDPEEASKILQILDETDEQIRKVKNLHVEKTKEMAVRTLVKNSKYVEGQYREKFEMKARQEGHKTKEAIAKYVHEKMQDVKVQRAINMKEFRYWNDLLHNGYTDIRYLEYLLADPGMNRSQFVQVVKNILDKVDNDKRIELDTSIPEIVNWHEKLSFKTTGDPKEVWKGFFETAKYQSIDEKDEKGNPKEISYTHASLIPEWTSKYRERTLKYKYKLEYLNREIRKAYSANNKARIEKLKEIQAEIKEKRDVELAHSKAAGEAKKHKNPAFEALPAEKQEALRYLHQKLKDSDDRLYSANHKKLVHEVEGTYIYNLPKMRKSNVEASYDKAGMISNFVSNIKDMWRPPADDDQMGLTDEEKGDITEEEREHADDLRAKNTDILGNMSYDVPVFYRNELEDPELQSFDIPTLLALNEETTITYQQHKMVEADLFMITNALKNSDALKTDGVISKKVKDAKKNFSSKNLKSDDNLTLKAVEASINNRFYKRSYTGAYSKTNYRLIKGAEALSKGTSSLLLAGNFRSATMTAAQGTIYRFVEGVAGEHFTLADVKKGTAKAYNSKNLQDIIADTQKQFPTGKTNLLIRRFGLETQYKALVNKFVQDNFMTKNMDEATVFSITSMAETMVTASLMYTLLGNIKVMNGNGDFINKEGKVVEKKDAMSLDEAYEVKDGVLVLHKDVVYTERNLTDKFRDRNGERTVASTQISGYIRSIYADLYGQYNQDMKSVAEMHIAGKLMFSMRKWLPRGMHRRWRGITSSTGYTFEELKQEENFDKRFFSQDQGKFQEGYYTTGVRYAVSMYKELKQKGIAFAAARESVKNTMNTHELANLKRLRYELGIIIVSGTSAALLASFAKALGEDDEDKRNDKLYYLLYLMERLYTESFTFLNPKELLDTLVSPAASVSVLQQIGELIKQVVGVSFEDNGDWDWNFNDTYERGPKKGEYKTLHGLYGFVPSYKNVSQFLGLFGLDTNESIEESYKFLSRQ